MKEFHRSITLDRVSEAANRQLFGTDNPGFCIGCGHEQEGCEPDATDITCESCGEAKVMGAAELLMELA